MLICTILTRNRWSPSSELLNKLNISRMQDRYMQPRGENRLEGINDPMRAMEDSKRLTGSSKLGVLEKLSIRRP